MAGFSFTQTFIIIAIRNDFFCFLSQESGERCERIGSIPLSGDRESADPFRTAFCRSTNDRSCLNVFTCATIRTFNRPIAKEH